MARLTDRGRRTRDRILQAAVQEFSAKGFSGTSVDDVLRASQAGKSQFYHYFENKADLVRAVLRHWRTESLPFGDPALGQLDSWERLEAWFDEIVQAFGQEHDAWRDLIGAIRAELLKSDDPLRREVVRTTRLRRRLLHRGLRRMKNRGELAADADPRRLATFAAAAIDGGIRLAHMDDSVAVLRDVLDQTLGGLRSHATMTRPELPTLP